MPQEYEVNPDTGIIRPIIGDGSYGSEQTEVDIYGRLYTVSGGRLTPIDGSFGEGYNLGRSGVSVLTYLSSGHVQLTNTIAQSGINSANATGRMYSVTGTMSVALPGRDPLEVEVTNASIAPAGMRVYASYGISGSVDYNYVPADVATNAQLREYVHDETARFLTPDEATERALIGYALSNNFGDLARMAAAMDLYLENGDLDISEAARLMVQANIAAMSAASDYIIQPGE